MNKHSHTVEGTTYTRNSAKHVYTHVLVITETKSTGPDDMELTGRGITGVYSWHKSRDAAEKAARTLRNKPWAYAKVWVEEVTA